MMATIEVLSEGLADHESPELAIAWEDLRSDLESVSRDLESARFSVDVDGLIERVENFRKEFATARGMSEKAEVWDQLTQHLKDLESLTQ
jgi:chorismate-pyruvate lyase